MLRHLHPCTDRKAIIASIARAGESPRGAGYDGEGAPVYELWVEDGKDPSWSFVASMPNGDACIVASGGVWNVIPHIHHHLGPRL